MSKKILILSGSPRKGGNSDILCDEFMRGAQDAGHTVEKIFVRDQKIGYCNACYACRESGVCVLKDGMQEVLEKMAWADVIVMASPVYFYSIDAQMKAVIDRTLAQWTKLPDKPLNVQEISALMTIADGMKNSVPCTACRYCTDHCPMGLDIPLMMGTCSELRFSPVINIAMRLEGLHADKQPSACIGCGACAQMCPQKIDIPGVMAELNETLSKIPKWVDICKQREEAAKKAVQGE